MKNNKTKPEHASYNFALAKIGAILMVFTGHYFGGVLWVPATVALFVMAFSSGFFTTFKYSGDFDYARFWRAKIERMGYRLLAVDIFLLALFLWQGKSGIWTWQTLLALPGLNGFFNWFSVPNLSPFGNGLWFLTVLWIFYLVYPGLEWINRKRPLAIIFIVAAMVVSMGLYHLNRLDHMLWMTIFAFLFGVFSARHRLRVRPIWALLVMIVCAGLLAEHNLWAHLNYLDYHLANYTLILIGSVATVYLLMEIRLPHAWFDRLLPWSSCVLEFYVIHFYLLTLFKGLPPLAGYILTMLVTIMLAWLLHKIQARVRGIGQKQIVPLHQI